MFPALRTIYGNRKYSAHIYTFVVAGAGAGKGGAMNGVILAKKTDQVVSLIQTTEKVGLYPNAAKRALKKYVANGLLSKNNGIYKKTSTMKKRDI